MEKVIEIIPCLPQGPIYSSWWRHQMETFSALLAICVGNSPVSGEFPAQRPVTRSFDVMFDLRMNQQLGKQSWGWWFETLPRPLWRHCNINPSHPGIITVMPQWTKWRLKSPASRLFAQRFVRAHIKETSKLRVTAGGFLSQSTTTTTHHPPPPTPNPRPNPHPHPHPREMRL